MTEFITKNHGHSCYEIMIKTTDPEHYKATQDFVRRLIDQADGVTFAEDRNVPSNPYWDNISRIAEKQRNKGMETYGHGVEDNPADIITRIEYLEEELIDGLMYCEWIKDRLNPRRGRWIVHSIGKDSWAECSECHVCGSPQWKVCPVCEAKMGYVEKIEPIKSCTDCENDGFDMPQCKHCSPDNDFMYLQKKRP